MVSRRRRRRCLSHWGKELRPRGGLFTVRLVQDADGGRELARRGEGRRVVRGDLARGTSFIRATSCDRRYSERTRSASMDRSQTS